MPCRANTYCTSPLQSNPEGSLPPLLYRTPRKSSAVASASDPGVSKGGAPGGATATAGGDATGDGGRSGAAVIGAGGSAAAGGAAPG